MKYLYIEPEVAGGLGERTVMDVSKHPPTVTRLHYEFDGWLGDPILASFPILIVTDEVMQTLRRISATGVIFDDVEVTTSDQFRDFYPDRRLPPFVWLKPVGQAGQDDIGAAPDGRLVVSQRVYEALAELGIPNALVEPFGAGDAP
jgi:hypothetical protein